VIQGGYDGSQLEDAWACDVVAGKWIRLPWSNQPRSRHTLTRGTLIGGFNAKDVIYSNCLELSDKNHPLESDFVPSKLTKSTLQRAGHASCMTAQGLVVVGGFVGEKRRLVGDLLIV
jgi:hypothetical protein